MVDLDIMAACYLIAPTSISSGDIIGSRNAIVVILYLSGWRYRMELSWLATLTGKVPFSPTIKTRLPFTWAKLCASDVPITWVHTGSLISLNRDFHYVLIFLSWGYRRQN